MRIKLSGVSVALLVIQLALVCIFCELRHMNLKVEPF